MKLPLFFTILFLLASCSEKNQTPSSHLTKNPVAQDSAQISYELQHANECLYTNLSSNFNFKVKTHRYYVHDTINDSCLLSIRVLDKRNEALTDSILIMSHHFRKTGFNDCYSVPSFATGVDTVGMSEFNEHGEDWVVADLNFDYLEDLAVLNHWGKGEAHATIFTYRIAISNLY